MNKIEIAKERLKSLENIKMVYVGADRTNRNELIEMDIEALTLYVKKDEVIRKIEELREWINDEVHPIIDYNQYLWGIDKVDEILKELRSEAEND